MSRLLFFIGLVVCIHSMACDKPAEQKLYSGCCFVPPSTGDIEGAKIYIPNAFTPNGDGINDIFFPLTSVGIEEIVSMEITDLDNNLIFEAADLDAGDIASGWKGKTGATTHKGLFNYTISIRGFGGEVANFSGRVCSYTCEIDQFPESNKPNCAFPSQHDGNGGFNGNINNLENDCF